MSDFNFKTHTKKILADTITPVSVYLKIRDVFPNSLLLESSDYHANDNSFSYICCNPLASISVKNEQLHRHYPDGSSEAVSLDSKSDLPTLIDAFAKRFSSEKNGYKFITHGLFGYISYDAVRYFEQVEINEKSGKIDIPDLYYAVYQNVIAINHFKNEAYIFCHTLDGQNNLSQIEQLLQSKNIPTYHFSKQGEAVSNLSDEEFKENVAVAKKHCHRGNVFQLVLSRRFQQAFKGDEFNVYRALRSINPSPYLFFFDYGDFKIFGSSPEAQLVVKDRKAEIHPIAGTFKRTGDDEQDAALAKQLSVDQKENSEHVMLVDLARNDLSRNGHEVTVEKYREVQYFSHVIHLVSKVTGYLHPGSITMRVVADTFPAGTLSGAPKHRAMQLIDKYEKTNRGFYGGALGFMDFEGNFNHAIMIRTFLSKNHHLYYQAGAGIVADSNEENEMQEVYNKLGALNNALEMAENI
ncbi:MAG: anthranilate synthase component I family protein [Flavobacteriaceae bacterium]|nr:anthranilate synthase component I family protein [Flavobacteriaceae bacterium]MDZ4146959.1 anthranilate synthase component I family protein [Flavobacteriaceae bacterium]